MLIAPSLLSADFGKINDEIIMLNQSSADWYHLDVMDGVFVPNISFGFPVIEAIAKIAAQPLDVHLMTVKPETLIDRLANIGVQVITVHYEACTHLHRVVQEIRRRNIYAGVALNPHTPVEVLCDILPYIDVAMLMGVNPGFGGQTFIPQTLAKTQRLRKMIDDSRANVKIEIDGGVNRVTAAQLRDAGADILVAGSSVFRAADPKAEIQALKQI